MRIIFYGYEWNSLILFLLGPLALFIMIYGAFEIRKLKKYAYFFVAWVFFLIFVLSSKKPLVEKISYYQNTTFPLEVIEPQIPSIIKEHQKPVILFFTARWCDSCKDLEERLKLKEIAELHQEGWIIIKVDVSDFSKYEEHILKKYNVYGVPALAFYTLEGEVALPLTLVGSETPINALISILDQLGNFPHGHHHHHHHH
ncbi:MAG: thioredoxin domain-containing protein [Leptospiraceae bacterium]|nr:thioredoxin domain-containing protein [Leptospiraceae bacterium]MDW7977130.1 thioredoxin domain-containing protein [Leptospiraceae bacterium]